MDRGRCSIRLVLSPHAHCPTAQGISIPQPLIWQRCDRWLAGLDRHFVRGWSWPTLPVDGTGSGGSSRPDQAVVQGQLTKRVFKAVAQRLQDEEATFNSDKVGGPL